MPLNYDDDDEYCSSQDSDVEEILEKFPNLERAKLRKKFSLTNSLKNFFHKPPHSTSKIDVKHVMQWRTSFEQLWANEVGMELFDRFLKSEEYKALDFWRACERYKKLPQNELRDEAIRLYNTYLNPWSNDFIFLGYDHKKLAEKSIQNPNPKSYDDAQRTAYYLMEIRMWPQFLDSDLFQVWLMDHNIVLPYCY